MRKELHSFKDDDNYDPDFDYVFNAWETIASPVWLLVRLFGKLLLEIVLLPIRVIRIIVSK